MIKIYLEKYKDKTSAIKLVSHFTKLNLKWAKSFIEEQEAPIYIQEIDTLEEAKEWVNYHPKDVTIKLVDTKTNNEIDYSQLIINKTEKEIPQSISVFNKVSQTKKETAFDIFISYKSQDEELAYKLYNLLLDNGHFPFFSKESIKKLGNSDYQDAIYQAIDEVKHFILISSNVEYIQSKWVKAEWKAFINEMHSGRKSGNFISVVSNNIDIKNLPIQLRQFEVVDFDTMTYSLLRNYLI